jgi:hypothetical protein
MRTRVITAAPRAAVVTPKADAVQQRGDAGAQCAASTVGSRTVIVKPPPGVMSGFRVPVLVESSATGNDQGGLRGWPVFVDQAGEDGSAADSVGLDGERDDVRVVVGRP